MVIYIQAILHLLIMIEKQKFGLNDAIYIHVIGDWIQGDANYVKMLFRYPEDLNVL